MKGDTKAKTLAAYLKALPDGRREDLKKLHALIVKTLPTFKPRMMYGMIGYGKYTYTYASGRTGEWSVVALASQKNYISLYICASDGKKYVPEKHKKALPKASIGKSCVRFKKLADVDQDIIVEMLHEAQAFQDKTQSK